MIGYLFDIMVVVSTDEDSTSKFKSLKVLGTV